MGRNLLTALSLLLALGLTDGAFRQFDCTRTGSECRNGGTCDALTGECTCNNIYQGYDCGLGTSLIRPTCTITCQNGGTCYVNPFNEECYCTPDFWGTTCEKPRQVMEACGPGQNPIVISIKPTGTFSGVIYISGEYGNPGCQFQYDAPNDDYRITLTDGDCPAGNTRETNVPTLGVVSSYTVIVQYNPAMVNSRDGRHVFSCVPNSLSTILTLPSIETGSLDGLNLAVNQQGVNSRFTTAPNRGVLPPIVYVGQELFLELYPAPNSGATDLAVTQCTASSPGSPDVLLVSNRCPDNFGTITVSLTKDDGSKTIFLRFKVFQFTGSNQLSITCSVAACGPSPPPLPEGACLTTTNCAAGGDPNIGRRKRETDVDDEVTVTISRELVIAATPQEAEILLQKAMKKSDTNTTTESCLYSVAFISVTAVCGVLLVVAVIALVLVFFRLRAGRGAEEINHPTKG